MEISFGINNFGEVSTKRNKGYSIVSFPDEYVVIDIETTGLSPDFDEIIELSAIKYVNNNKVAEFTSLVKPLNEIDEYITDLTGITNEMVKDAPMIEEIIEDYINFIGSNIVVGYNVNFDINFIYDNLMFHKEKEFKNDFIDVMRISKKALSELPKHRQKDIANYYKINIDGSHRALKDCEICNECFKALKEDIMLKTSLDEFTSQFKKRGNDRTRLMAKSIAEIDYKLKEDSILSGKVCAFTGVLEKMLRKEAMEIVIQLGGIPSDNVTKKTNYLILGNNDYCSSIKDGKSAKQKKAEQLILKGVDMEILSEQVFYDLIFDNE